MLLTVKIFNKECVVRKLECSDSYHFISLFITFLSGRTCPQSHEIKHYQSKGFFFLNYNYIDKKKMKKGTKKVACVVTIYFMEKKVVSQNEVQHFEEYLQFLLKNAHILNKLFLDFVIF